MEILLYIEWKWNRLLGLSEKHMRVRATYQQDRRAKGELGEYPRRGGKYASKYVISYENTS